MPHYMCKACRTRLHSAATSDDSVGDLCPDCGSLLEPVGDLAEIVGYRAIRRRDAEDGQGPPGTHQRIAGQVDDFFARRDERLARARLDAERWLDDGGSFSTEAVAVAVPKPPELR